MFAELLERRVSQLQTHIQRTLQLLILPATV